MSLQRNLPLLFLQGNFTLLVLLVVHRFEELDSVLAADEVPAIRRDLIDDGSFVPNSYFYADRLG